MFEAVEVAMFVVCCLLLLDGCWLCVATAVVVVVIARPDIVSTLIALFALMVARRQCHRRGCCYSSC